MTDFEFYLSAFDKANQTFLSKGGQKISSPLEKAFLGYWFMRWGINSISEGCLTNNMRNTDYVKKIIPQYKLDLAHGNYFKIDFVMICVAASKNDMHANAVAKEEFEILYKPNLYPKEFRIAVELDGHTFHERTKEQVSERNIRDNELQKRKYFVHHISYDQLYNNFSDVIYNISDLIINIAGNIRETL